MLFAFTFLQLLKLIPGGDFAKWSIQRLQKEFFNTPIIIRKRGGKEVWERWIMIVSVLLSLKIWGLY